MSLPRYPEYKDSGVEWLGEVPGHWDVAPLKRLLDIQNGVDHKPVEAEFGVPVIGSGGPFAYASVAIYDGETVLLGRKGTIDRPMHVQGAFWTVDTMYWSKIQPNTCGRFAYYTATTIPFGYYSTSTALPSMTKSALNAHLVSYPDYAEQVSIATFLDRETAKIDALIAEQEKLIALLAEKRQATISYAVTRGLDPDVPMKDSGVAWLGEVPAHWDVTRLKFVAFVQTGIAKGKDMTGKETITVPYLRVANVQDGFLEFSDIATIDIEPEQLDRYRLMPGDVLMNEGGDFDKLGRGAIWGGEIPDCIHQNHVFAVRPHGVTSGWLNQVTSSQYAQFYFMGRSKQSTNLASISSSNIMELPVVMPSAEEQREILAFIDSETTKLDVLKAEAARAITLLKERRSALIAAAVTGQIDVRGAAQPRQSALP